MSGQIVVGIDESEGSAGALRWAVREAELRDTTVLAVLAWSWIDQHPGDGFDPQYSAADAESALEAAVNAAVTPAQVRLVERHAVCDLPFRALLDAAAGQEMLVVGARGLGGFAGLLVGSVSQHCIQDATIPTVVVREHTTQGERAGIVVGIDGSEHSQTALDWAVDEARRRACRLTVVHAYHLPIRSYVVPAFDPARQEADARRLMDGIIGAVDSAGLDIATVITPNGPAGALIEAGSDAGLVVVGSRGRGALGRLNLGSTAAQVLHHAPCSVAIIPAG